MPFEIYPLLRPFLFSLDPEAAHHLALKSLKNRFFPTFKIQNEPVLHTTVAGFDFKHPIGLAAGFDKQAEVVEEAFKLGFAFSEIGGVTPLPQQGNPKPRLFRLPEAKALINRLNFNGIGFDEFLKKMQSWHAASTTERRKIVGINIARGDNCRDDAAAYIQGLKLFAPYARFITINVSCPNEPDARNLEGRDQLKNLLDRVKEAQTLLDKKPRLFIKISPDQTPQQTKDIAEVALGSGIDGIIIGNTTTSRPGLKTIPLAQERGGLSGLPLSEMSTDLIHSMYQLTAGKIPLIGCGGVFTGMDAYKKIRAGASLIQIYTALVYEGPGVVKRIVQELAAHLKQGGYTSVSQAVGVDHKKA